MNLSNKNPELCFVYLTNLDAAPYLKIYLEVIDCTYDIIYWDRRGEIEKTKASNSYRFQYIAGYNQKIRVLIGYIKFRKFAIKLLKKNKYKKVIFLTSNTAVLLSPYIYKNQQAEYIIDIRDYWKENKKWYYTLEKKVIEKSKIAFISSESFRKFLPPHKYYVTHNVPIIEAQDRKKIIEINKNRRNFDRKLVLVCVGGMKWQKYDEKVISYFANDDRFELRYIGNGYEKLYEFCELNKIHNVKIKGRFPSEETLDYFTDVDAILNLYGNGIPLFDYALSNKLYFAAYLELPIIVCPNTSMEDVVHKYEIGITVDINDIDCKQCLYKYLLEYNDYEFHHRCELFIDAVSDDMSNFRRLLMNFAKK